MRKIRDMGAFEVWDKATVDDLKSGRAKLPGFQQITCHMVFDIKMDGSFTRKARFVANGAQTRDVPAYDTYASVVTRESVRIAFLHAALNGLDVLACDVSNAYLNAPCKEKIWFKAGKEFGDEEGMVMIVRKALYGLKSSGNSWRQMLSSIIIEQLGYESTRADPDVYRRLATKPNGEKYYELLLTYVDDCLCISHGPEKTMDALSKLFELRESVKKPDRYLGANVSEWKCPDGHSVWSMDGKDYVANAVRIVKDMLAVDGTGLSSKGSDRPMPITYRPELDVSPELEEPLTGRYHQLIGILRWAVELGRADILYEVSLLSSHLAHPREGHLKAVYSIFAYLNKHVNSPLIFDDLCPHINENAFPDTDWSQSIYGDVTEEIPHDAPTPYGKPITMSCFVDASFANDKITRRSHTGFIIYANNSPIEWYSKKQTTVESSTFGAEFVALRIAIEKVKALRYKLRMFGIPIEGPTNIFCDNEGVVKSSGTVTGKLNKKQRQSATML